MTDLNAMLNKLYEAKPEVTKTASDRFMEAIRPKQAPVETEKVASADPFASMSTAELAKLALDIEATLAAEQAADVPAAEPAATTEVDASIEEEIQKVAMDTLGGQIMAHAMVHELKLVKTATLKGLCRACKTKPRDAQGSLCADCGK